MLLCCTTMRKELANRADRLQHIKLLCFCTGIGLDMASASEAAQRPTFEILVRIRGCLASAASTGSEGSSTMCLANDLQGPGCDREKAVYERKADRLKLVLVAMRALRKRFQLVLPLGLLSNRVAETAVPRGHILSTGEPTSLSESEILVGRAVAEEVELDLRGDLQRLMQ